MTDHSLNDHPKPGRNANTRLAFGLVLFVAGMVGLSFAAVPLYQIFCQVTGYGGTTQRADAAPTTVLDRAISIRFNANTAAGLGWDFRPVQNRIDVKIGENKLAFYKAVNPSDEPVTGTASFNVTPEVAGGYFAKVDCFCFTEQTLQPGQAVDMPVSFFVDPAIMDDPDTKHLEEITLSYTFFKIDTPEEGTAEAEPAADAATTSFEKGAQSG